MKPYIVLTSKPATKDLENIKATHADLLKSMANQADKVANYKAQKASELQAQQTLNAEMGKEKMLADSQAQKDALSFQQKQAELDIKRAALTKV